MGQTVIETMCYIDCYVDTICPRTSAYRKHLFVTITEINSQSIIDKLSSNSFKG